MMPGSLSFFIEGLGCLQAHEKESCLKSVSHRGEWLSTGKSFGIENQLSDTPVNRLLRVLHGGELPDGQLRTQGLLEQGAYETHAEWLRLFEEKKKNQRSQLHVFLPFGSPIEYQEFCAFLQALPERENLWLHLILPEWGPSSGSVAQEISRLQETLSEFPQVQLASLIDFGHVAHLMRGWITPEFTSSLGLGKSTQSFRSLEEAVSGVYDRSSSVSSRVVLNKRYRGWRDGDAIVVFNGGSPHLARLADFLTNKVSGHEESPGVPVFCRVVATSAVAHTHLGTLVDRSLPEQSLLRKLSQKNRPQMFLSDISLDWTQGDYQLFSEKEQRSNSLRIDGMSEAFGRLLSMNASDLNPSDCVEWLGGAFGEEASAFAVVSIQRPYYLLLKGDLEGARKEVLRWLQAIEQLTNDANNQGRTLLVSSLGCGHADEMSAVPYWFSGPNSGEFPAKSSAANALRYCVAGLQ